MMPSHAGISATNKAFMEAFSKGDATELHNLYTKGGSLLPPNSDVIGESRPSAGSGGGHGYGN